MSTIKCRYIEALLLEFNWHFIVSWEKCPFLRGARYKGFSLQEGKRICKRAPPELNLSSRTSCFVIPCLDYLNTDQKNPTFRFFISGKFKYFPLICCSGKSNYFINQTNEEALKLCTGNENLFLMTLQKKKHLSRGATWGMVEASPVLFSKSKKSPDLGRKKNHHWLDLWL